MDDDQDFAHGPLIHALVSIGCFLHESWRARSVPRRNDSLKNISRSAQIIRIEVFLFTQCSGSAEGFAPRAGRTYIDSQRFVSLEMWRSLDSYLGYFKTAELGSMTDKRAILFWAQVGEPEGKQAIREPFICGCDWKGEMKRSGGLRTRSFRVLIFGSPALSFPSRFLGVMKVAHRIAELFQIGSAIRERRERDHQ
jgi:hypothetical protein